MPATPTRTGKISHGRVPFKSPIGIHGPWGGVSIRHYMRIVVRNTPKAVGKYPPFGESNVILLLGSNNKRPTVPFH